MPDEGPTGPPAVALGEVLLAGPPSDGIDGVVADGSVEPGSGGASWRVRGSRGWVYDVTPGDDGLRCTCTWQREHGTGRGPCKHVLAVLISLRE